VTSVSYSPAPDSAFEKLFKRARGVQFRGTSSDNEPEASIAATPRHQVDPDVPTFIAEALTEEVRVSLRVSIDKLGQITDVEPLAPLPEHRLVGLAGTAARKWEFEPARSKGRPVASRLILNFRFRNPHPRTAPLKGLTAAKPF
jgi:outer membrane biosynthesis protein TonB